MQGPLNTRIEIVQALVGRDVGEGTTTLDAMAGNDRCNTLIKIDVEGAELEARSLQALLPRSQLLGKGKATEQKVKELRRPALLHIVGHGLVRGNEDCTTDAGSPGCALSNMDPGARAMSLSVDWFGVLVLVTWGTLAGLAALRWFRFT